MSTKRERKLRSRDRIEDKRTECARGGTEAGAIFFIQKKPSIGCKATLLKSHIGMALGFSYKFAAHFQNTFS